MLRSGGAGRRTGRPMPDRCGPRFQSGDPAQRHILGPHRHKEGEDHHARDDQEDRVERNRGATPCVLRQPGLRATAPEQHKSCRQPVIRSSPARGPRHGASDLTPREARVARLAADGATNAETRPSSTSACTPWTTTCGRYSGNSASTPGMNWPSRKVASARLEECFVSAGVLGSRFRRRASSGRPPRCGCFHRSAVPWCGLTAW